MILGEQVLGAVMDPRYRFVTGDQSDLHRRIQEIDPNLRLAAHSENRDVIAVVWVPLDRLGDDFTDDNTGLNVQGPNGAWLIAFRCTNQDGSPMIGEPNASVLEQARRASTTNRRREDLQDWARTMLKAQERFEAKVREQMADEIAGALEPAAYAATRQSRLWVPNGV